MAHPRVLLIWKFPPWGQSKRLTEKTLLQKRMTKIDIAYRNKVSKTGVFPDLFFLTKLLRNQTTRTELGKHLTKAEVDKANEKLWHEM